MPKRKKITLTIKSRKECLQKKKNQSVQMAQTMCRPQPNWNIVAFKQMTQTSMNWNNFVKWTKIPLSLNGGSAIRCWWKNTNNVKTLKLKHTYLLFLLSSSSVRIITSRQWCEMTPCLEDEGCNLLVNQSGWTCTQPGGRVKTTTVRKQA